MTGNNPNLEPPAADDVALTPAKARHRRVTLGVQIAVIFGTWLFVWWLHADNDGLWFQGDAPRHATNGLFWLDFLRDFTFDAKTYALRYYARYPAINPAAYPPLFYLLEAGAFAVFGPSPFAAKALVLVSSLVAALYTCAWLHRWIDRHVAWMAALLLLMPNIVLWSHAVMLNVPALALMVGTVYHGRRWLESDRLRGRSRHFYLAAGLATAAVLTYYPAGVVLLVIAAWMLAVGGWQRLGRRHAVAVALTVAVFVPCLVLAVRSAPTHVSWVTESLREAWKPASWTYYVQRFPGIFGPTVLVLASAGWLVGVSDRKWRRETWWLSSWIVVTYCVFSVLVAKESRYILFLAPPLVCLCAVAVLAATHRLSASRSVANPLFIALAAGVLGLQVWTAWHRPVPSVRGFREVVDFLKQVAPAEPVLYDGYHNGIFAYHVRAADPYLERQVVLGNKLLYTYALEAGWREQLFVASADDVVQRLREQGGCRWLAIEVGDRSQRNPAMRHLREAVRTPDFELVRSFSIAGPKIERVDVYRMLGAVERRRTVRLPFPLISSDTLYEVEPIPSRRRRPEAASS